METKILNIVFVIDESGSMQGSNADVIGGFNSYIDRHRNEPNARVNVSLYKFNDQINQVITNKPVKEVDHLTDEDYFPNGFTALYDAVGLAINNTDESIEILPMAERPTTTMMVIITDGQENASRNYSSVALKSTVATHEKMLNWQFIFLGADLKNFTDAEQLGMSKQISFRKRNIASKFDTIADAGILYCLKSDERLDANELLNDLKD